MTNINFGVLITVSLKSKRLKRKALLKFGNQNLIESIIDRMKKICPAHRIILITSNKKNDYPLKKIAIKKKIKYFLGDQLDVLHRMNQAALKFKIKNFISTTGDNPFVDHIFAKKMIKFHIKNKYAFTEIKGLPWGAFSYAVNLKALSDIVNFKKKKDTEVWGNYFRKYKKNYCGVFEIKNKKFYNYNLRLTIDYKKDLEFGRKILSISKKKFPISRDIVDLIKNNKKLLKINSSIKQKKAPKKYY